MLKIYKYDKGYSNGFSMEAEMDSQEDFALFMKIFQDAILVSRTLDSDFTLDKKSDYYFITAYKLKQRLEFIFLKEDSGFGIWVGPADPKKAQPEST